jgi:hypothetical protein
MGRDPFFLEADASGGILQAGHVELRVGDRLFRENACTIPVFWTTLFDREELTAQAARTNATVARDRARSRTAAWKERASPLLLRGYLAFAAWLERAPDGAVQIDVSHAESWRRERLLAAAVSFIDFLDGRTSEPGPLLSGYGEHVTFRRGSDRGPARLVGVGASARWPDEEPLFVGRMHQLVAPTMGLPPFRRGPFPEWRVVEDPCAPLPERANDRARQAEDAARRLSAARASVTAAQRGGNLDLVARARADWQHAAETSQAMAESAADFAERFAVFDDGDLWRKTCEEHAHATAQLDALEAAIRAAME